MQDCFFPHPAYQDHAMANEWIEKVLAFISKYIATALPVVVILGALWGIFIYTIHSEIQSAISGMSGDVGIMKTQVSELGVGLGKTNDRIDNLLKDALERAFPRPAAVKTDTKSSLSRANDLLELAKSENIKLNSQLIADYGKALTTIHEPAISAAAWQTLANLLSYRSVLNASLAPSAKDIKLVSWNVTFPVMFFQGATGFSVSASKQSVPMSQAARIEAIAGPMAKIQSENPPSNVGPMWYVMKVRTPHTIQIGLDDMLFRNVIIQDAVISYQGGPVRLDHVIFINCTFNILQGEPAKGLASSMLASSTVTYSFPNV